jgi:cytosine/uracil/thiamine/allantoin permease
MPVNKLKLVLAGIFILVMIALMLWFPSHAHQAALRDAVEQADRDVAAAKAAADAAAVSAAKARDAARDLQNRLPGDS